MNDLVFDTPWWLPTVIAIAGAWMLTDGNRRGRDGLRNAGAAVFLAAVALVAVSFFVDTDKETCLKRTGALVDSVEKQDWPRFASLLDDNTSFAGYSGKSEMVDGAKRSAALIGLKKAYVTSKTARQTDTLITVAFDAASEQDMPPYPVRSSWEVDWQQRGERWLLYRVTLVAVNGQPADAAVGRLPSVPHGRQ